MNALVVLGAAFVAFLVVRLVVIAILAVVHHASSRASDVRRLGVADRPRVSVVVPAFDEAAVIAGTLRSIAASDYPDVEILVVDDGSRDGTAAIAEATGIRGLVVLRQERNAGKAAALNRGIAEAKGEVIVTVDADTHLARDCITVLVQTMVSTEADAVAANVKVGNRAGALGLWQSLEYVTGFNLLRRAQAALGAIQTVPGATAAWRRSAIPDGFSRDTLAEDTDRTLQLLRAGGRVVFADRAVTWTETPSTWRGLFRQRVRWLHGNLQCAWKHSGAFVDASPWRVKLVALPDLWLTHLAMQALFPLFVTALAGVATARHPVDALGMLGSLVALDVLAAALAYTLDRERAVELVFAPIQRLAHPFFAFAVFAAVAQRVLTGATPRWNKVDRTGALGND